LSFHAKCNCDFIPVASCVVTVIFLVAIEVATKFFAVASLVAIIYHFKSRCNYDLFQLQVVLQLPFFSCG
jgi:hypothetical protein